MTKNLNCSKRNIFIAAIVGMFFIPYFSKAQTIKENVEPLSAKAKKGYMYDARKDENGITNVIYKMKGERKSDAISFEKYSFDKDLKFLGASEVRELEEDRADKEKTILYANVGGTNSFNVLSMKIKMNRRVVLQTWNHERQLFINKKVLSNETVKARNDEGKVYLGFASYDSSDPEKDSEVFNIVKIETKEKGMADRFYILMFNFQMEQKEIPVELNGDFTLVYCQQIKGDDVVMVFAPNKGAADISNYVYFRYDIKGNLKNKVEFKSPSSALFITGAYEFEDNIYFFGTASKTKDAFEQVYHEYAPIYNPGSGAEDGNNIKDIIWRKHLKDGADIFYFLKFSENQFALTSTTPVKDFKTKFKTAPGDKGASVYKGKKFFIESFSVTPDEDYLIAGQLTGSVTMGINGKQESYEDIVCFHFNKAGVLKAQYGIGKMNNDKKCEIFNMRQTFYMAPDGKSLYWEIMEVKGIKGFESFVEAYLDVPSYYELFFPRIVKIDLNTSSLGAIKTLGEGKYFLKRNFTKIFDQNEKTITYIGHDADWKKLWISKMITD
jgi:hypothetical protein